MTSFRNRASAAALALGVIALGAAASNRASAAARDYRFEMVGKPKPMSQGDIVQVHLIHIPDGKAVADAVVFESTADMGPQGMATMGAPVKAMPARDGIYGFAVEPAMAGTWAIHLSAKVQGEAETVHGTITADLVK